MKTETLELGNEITLRIDEIKSAIEKIELENCEKTLFFSFNEDWEVIKKALIQQRKKLENRFENL